MATSVGAGYTRVRQMTTLFLPPYVLSLTFRTSVPALTVGPESADRRQRGRFPTAERGAAQRSARHGR